MNRMRGLIRENILSSIIALFLLFFLNSGASASTLWDNTVVPAILADSDTSAVELGVKFQSDADGFITALRFYKSSGNTGTHVGHLWTAGGTLLASVTFTNETASGWQEMALPTPVAITANTTYVASYHTNVGRYSADSAYFTSAYDNPPLTAPSSSASGGNGVYRYGASAFPNQTYNATNYWIDVVFEENLGPDTTPPTVISTLPARDAVNVSITAPITVTFSEAMDGGTINGSTFELLDAANAPVPAVVSYNSGSNTATLDPTAQLDSDATYTATVDGVTDVAGNQLAAAYTWSFFTAAAGSSGGASLWDNTFIPAILADSDTSAVELGVKFQSDVDGNITALRFYKSSTNTGTHVGNLWTAGGMLLASVTFTNETASGWQEMALPAPVAITANTTYVASYHTNVGRYSANSAYFTSAYNNSPLTALSSSASGGNGVYRYGASAFPNQTYNATNYWVDVVFQEGSGSSDTTPPVVTAFTIPSTSTTLTVLITTLTATDNIGVTGFLVNETPATPSTSDNGWSATPPASYTFGSAGIKTLYAWAKDASGNVSASLSDSVTITLADTTAPTVNSVSPTDGATGVATDAVVTVTFSEAMNPATINTTTFTLNGVTATVTYDAGTNTATLDPTAPLDPGTTYAATIDGVTDAAGNPLAVPYNWSFTTASSSGGDTTAPQVTAFAIPATATTLTVPINSFTATDNVGVTGYLVNESPTAPSASAGGWSATAPASYTFTTVGSKTLYAWAKDAADNVSTSLNASVTITLPSAGPEPAGWYAGDMHVHRSCGGSPYDMDTMLGTMDAENLAVISLLADMGNGEVQDPVTDLPLVNGQDDPISTPDRIVHWDAEWHWDATYTQFPHQALGGHIVALGLSEAYQVWEEYTYPIFEWAHQRGGIAGFAHMQYLDDGFPQSLDCCTPIEYPVEVALGAADFISEDVGGSDSFIRAYYRLLNTGFRTGFAAGSDFPCGQDVGALLTYVQVAGGVMTYDNWIEGIAQGRTVVSRNGHNEFLSLTVNGSATPGDEINLTGGGTVSVAIQWTANQNLSGTVELVKNGVVVNSVSRSVSQGSPASLTTTVDFTSSGWLAARRMGANGHVVHTAAVFVTVDGAPVRASVADAEFYVQWMTELLQKTSPGGVWNDFFPTNLAEAQARYQAARDVFQQIAIEAGGGNQPPTVISMSPVNGATNVGTGITVTATFSEPMDPATINDTTFVLRNSSNQVVPATVTYNASTNRATLSPTNPLADSTTYTSTVAGGSGGVTDAAGTPMSANFSWSFTTAAAGSSASASLWDDTFVPTILSDSDTNAVELGVKLQSDVDGYITALRFYKSSTNTGTHVGNLWTAGGMLLASVTFTNETGSGWQEMPLPTPVAITAGTTYVASYHTNVGRYSADSAYFTSAYVNSPLQAPSSGASGGNGVYRYGAASGFPNQTYNATNYWVDVVFEENVGPPDTTPPTVTGFTIPSTSDSLAVPITTFTATDDVGVTGYMVTESSATPSAGAGGWSASAPSSYTFDSEGTKTLYAWAKDAAGNVSASLSASVTITLSDTESPQVTAFAIPATSTTLTVPITNFTATDNIAVTGYLVSESSATPSAGAAGWSATAPASYTFDAAGSKALYAWAKDAAGNVSASASASVTITLSDTTPPAVNSTAPSSGATGVSIGTQVVAIFSEPMDPATITSATFTLNGVAAAVVYTEATNTATLSPAAALANATTYTARVVGGTSGVKDLAGNTMATDVTWSFTTASSSGGDTTPPTVTAVLPPNDAPAVSTGTSLAITFNEAMTASTINTGTIELRNDSGTLVSAAVTYDGTTNRATVTPNSPLAVSAAYTATVKGGAGGVKDAAGNALGADYGWAFVTSASNPFGNGPGGPILVVTSAASPFSRYYAEILRVEGLNAFAMINLSSVTETELNQYDVVVLPEMPLTSNQVTLFTNWVTNGGNLIAMRPDKKLAGLLGLTDLGTTLSEGYLLVNTASDPGAGIVGQTIQFHGTADRYTLGSASALATLYSTATSATASPAVTVRSVGTNGGQAAAFTFDLARSVVYTRQGNPAWVGQERDGYSPIRASDLFYPDWIDLNKVAIPQADEQQRLLANMIIRMNADKKPLPRFWYLPNDHEAVVIMSGDDHGNDGTVGRFNAEIISSDPGCSVDNWECVRSSSYIYPDPDGAVTDEEAADFTDLGFEIGLHASTFCADYTADMLETYFSDQMGAWYGLFPSLEPPVSHRQHCIAWSGYTVLPEEEAKYGIRLDVNYYYWPPDWINNRPGFFTGSGMPMRFAATNGTIIDVYQATTQMTDESGQTYPYTINTLLDRAIGPEKYYGVFTTNMHTDYATSGDYDALIAAAQARGVPVISARQMLSWLDGRNGSSFGSIAWNGTVLSFTVSRAQGANGLQAMVPLAPGGSVAGVTRNGSAVGYAVRQVKGISYAVFPASVGSYEVNLADDATPPTVVDTAPPDGAVDVSTTTAVTVSFSEPMDEGTIGTGTFELRDAASGLVPAVVTYNSGTNTATLTPTAPLDPEAAYTATVDGAADLAGNPLSAPYSWSFTTKAAPPVGGPVAAYGFEEGSGLVAADSSGNANDGTLSGAVWTASGRFGNALSFNGSSARVNVLDSPSLDLTTAMTLEAWVYPTALSGWRTVILKETSNGLAYSLYAHDNAPRPAAYVNLGGGDISALGTQTLPLNTWTHLATTYDGSVLRIFVNGNQVGSRSVGGSIVVSSSALRLGGNAPWGEYFAGRIDEVRIYDRTLTQAEILADMNTPVVEQ